MSEFKFIVALDASQSMELMPINALETIKEFLDEQASKFPDITLEMFYFGTKIDSFNKISCKLSEHSIYIDYKSKWRCDMKNTSLYEAIVYATTLASDKFTLLIVTDGQDNSSMSWVTMDPFIEKFQKNGNKLIIIGPDCDAAILGKADQVLLFKLDDYHNSFRRTLPEDFSQRVTSSIKDSM